MSKIPVTASGLSEDQAIEAGTALREGWDILRSLQFNKTASILRYTTTDEGKPHLGIAPTEELVSGLSDLDVYISRISTREVAASKGILELSDMLFEFWDVEVLETDLISWGGKTYNVIQVKDYDPDVGACVVIGRAV